MYVVIKYLAQSGWISNQPCLSTCIFPNAQVGTQACMYLWMWVCLWMRMKMNMFLTKKRREGKGERLSFLSTVKILPTSLIIKKT